LADQSPCVLHRLKSGKRDNLFSSRFVQQGHKNEVEKIDATNN
jgi:hypothetical protein